MLQIYTGIYCQTVICIVHNPKLPAVSLHKVNPHSEVNLLTVQSHNHCLISFGKAEICFPY